MRYEHQFKLTKFGFKHFFKKWPLFLRLVQNVYINIYNLTVFSTSCSINSLFNSVTTIFADQNHFSILHFLNFFLSLSGIQVRQLKDFKVWSSITLNCSCSTCNLLFIVEKVIYRFHLLLNSFSVFLFSLDISLFHGYWLLQVSLSYLSLFELWLSNECLWSHSFINLISSWLCSREVFRDTLTIIELNQLKSLLPHLLHVFMRFEIFVCQQKVECSKVVVAFAITSFPGCIKFSWQF